MSEEPKEPGESKDEATTPPPPVDFRIFCEGFVGQALYHLGKYPHPTTGETRRDLPWAKYFIDLVGMLADKTKGNLPDDERMFLETMLSTLRLTYVQELKGETK